MFCVIKDDFQYIFTKSTLQRRFVRVYAMNFMEKWGKLSFKYFLEMEDKPSGIKVNGQPL